MKAQAILNRARHALPWMGAVLSGGGLAVAFPPWEQSEAAWFALVPLLLALRGQPPKRAFALGLATGGVAWVATISWLSKVTVAGMLLLSLYCALYIAVFAWGAAALYDWIGTGRLSRNGLLMMALPVLWVGLEFLRSILFTGFAWNALGISQYRSISLIQAARLGGVYLVSALLILVNAAVALTIFRYIDLRGRWRRQPHVELIAAFLVVGLTILAGFRSLRADPPVPTTAVRIGIVQTAIPQYRKWTADFVDTIYRRLETWTRRVQQVEGLNLVVWPETSVPDYIRDSRESYDLVRGLATNGTPILVGSMDFRWPEEGGADYFNSSLLFDREGRLIEVYDKQHLVMFGEYIPLEPLLPFMNALTPINESFTPGGEATLLPLPDTEQHFAVLICFEDTVAALSREAVRTGARLLINQTNDAWFDVSSGSRQHMMHSVFRSVENGVPLVRSANTGVSCAIDRRGRLTAVLEDSEGNTIFPGFITPKVYVPPDEMPLTPYTRYGDVFAGSCAAVALACLGRFLLLLKRRRGYTGPDIQNA